MKKLLFVCFFLTSGCVHRNIPQSTFVVEYGKKYSQVEFLILLDKRLTDMELTGPGKNGDVFESKGIITRDYNRGAFQVSVYSDSESKYLITCSESSTEQSLSPEASAYCANAIFLLKMIGGVNIRQQKPG